MNIVMSEIKYWHAQHNHRFQTLESIVHKTPT